MACVRYCMLTTYSSQQQNKEKRQRAKEEEKNEKRYELLLYSRISKMISQFGLRPAAVEIIQGCVYHYKYFELLNSNSVSGGLNGATSRAHGCTLKRRRVVQVRSQSIAELSDLFSLRHIRMFALYDRPADSTSPVIFTYTYLYSD